VTIVAGETLEVTVGGIGRPVTGKLVPEKGFESSPDWNFGYVEITPKYDEKPIDAALYKEIQKLIPNELADETDYEKRIELFKEWTTNTEEGKLYQKKREELRKQVDEIHQSTRENQLKCRVSTIADDGTFRLDDVFAGNWTLQVYLKSPPPVGQCGTGESIGTLTYDVTVDDIPGGVSDEPLVLGTLTVEKIIPPQPMPQPGDVAPDFEAKQVFPYSDVKQTDAEKTFKLSNYRGKYVILDFWATWCGPCIAQLPELKECYAKFADNDKVVLISISLDEKGQEEMLAKFIAKKEMNWLHVLSGSWGSNIPKLYSVNAIPAMFLIDPEGKILLTNPNIEQLTQTLENAVK
jgi:peroxiredoxin